MLLTAEQKAEAKQKLGGLTGEYGAIVKRLKAEKRKPTDDEQRRLDEIQREFDEVEARFLDEADPILEGRRINPESRGGPLKTGKFRELCERTGTPYNLGQWESEDEFFRAVSSRQLHPKLLENRVGQQEATGPEGGYSVPAQVAATILDESLESEVVRPRAKIWPMRSNELRAPAWEDEDHSGGQLYSGISATWASEGSTLSVQEPKLREIRLMAMKLAFLGVVSNELNEDSNTYFEAFKQALAGAISFHLDDAFLSGNGVGKPLGVLNSGCLVTQAKDSGQAAATITYSNLAGMYARLLPASRSRAVWCVNSTALPQLLQLTVVVSSGGSHIPVMSETNGSLRMLTRPVVVTEKLPILGSAGDILLADFSRYNVGLRTDVRLDVSPHLRFDQDQTTVRLRLRVDGQPTMTVPLTPKNGDTLSPFVVLEAR